MAMSIRGFLRNNLKFLSSSILKPVSNNVSRPLYSASSLAIDSYANARRHITNQFESVSQTFRAKMTEFTNEDNKSIIFTEDLKAMLHIVDSNKEDIELVMKMLKKFHTQNNELRFGNYVFGPVVMRAFYYLDLPDVALEAFKDPQLQGFFDQLTSYQILLTLLYNHKRYSDMREIYDLIKTKYTGGIMHPQNSVILVLAACYKENTPESFQYALDLWKELHKKGFEPNRKAVCLIATLALNQGKPEFALELISSCPQFRHIDVRCIKIQAYTALNRLEDVAQYIKKMMQSERFTRESTTTLSFFQDTIDKVEEALKKAGEEQNEELVRVLDELKSQNMVQNKTLDESLTRTIERRRQTDRQNNNTNTGRYGGSSDFKGFQRQRTGMKF